MDIFGYSLWFTPPSDISRRFTEVINSLSTRLKAPVFQPHVTVVGEIPLKEEEIIARLEKVLSLSSPFVITLTELNYQDAYFRSLYVLARPSDELRKIHDLTQQAMSLEVTDYMPHLSVLYGKYPPEVKERLIEELGINQLAHFPVNEIHLVQSSGDESTWKIKHSFPLRGHSKTVL